MSSITLNVIGEKMFQTKAGGEENNTSCVQCTFSVNLKFLEISKQM